MIVRFASVGFVCLVVAAAHTADDDMSRLIERVRAVGPQGAGSAEARAACDQLARHGPELLPVLLKAMDTDNVVAANWLRGVFEAIWDRSFGSAGGGRAAQATLSAQTVAAARDDLRAVVLDPSRGGRVRRLALERLTELEPTAPDTLIPPLLNDPEFRFDAVAVALDQAEAALAAGNREQSLAGFSKAFEAARDENQVSKAAARLKELGEDANIVGHLGFLVDWELVGPFHGPDFTAFATVYPPERKVDLGATYEGRNGRVGWKHYRTPNEFGTVDLVAALGPADDAAAYGYTVIESDRPRELELRCGADDNLSLWLNGEKIFAKEEYQNGTRFDRFVVPIRLRAGENTLLVKACQGPKYADPGLSNPWSFQIRLCDSAGTGIVFKRSAK